MAVQYSTEMPVAAMAMLMHITIRQATVVNSRHMPRIERQRLVLRCRMTKIMHVCPYRHRLEHESRHE